jgi:membrane protein
MEAKTPRKRIPGVAAYRRVSARVDSVSRRGQEWVDRQDPASARGVAIGAWRRYQAVDGPLQTALLSLYFMIAVLPALLVMVEYLERNPLALAHHLTRHFSLNAPTSSLLESVLSSDRQHELGSALFAVAGALICGVGFGKVLQIVHVRAWKLPFHAKQVDQLRYAWVLLAIYGMILLLLVQLKEIAGRPQWADPLIAPGWIVLLIVFFVWAPWMLTHKLIPARELVPGAVLTAVGLVVLMLVSSYVGQFWVDLYARDYGGFGVVMAIYFWLAFSSAVIVMSAALSPALAERRSLRAISRAAEKH